MRSGFGPIKNPICKMLLWFCSSGQSVLWTPATVFHFSGDPELVSMLCRLFGSFSGVLTKAQLGSFFSFAQYRS